MFYPPPRKAESNHESQKSGEYVCLYVDLLLFILWNHFSLWGYSCDGVDCGDIVSKWLTSKIDYSHGSVRLVMFQPHLSNTRTLTHNGSCSPKMVLNVNTLNQKVSDRTYNIGRKHVFSDHLMLTSYQTILLHFFSDTNIHSSNLSRFL